MVRTQQVKILRFEMNDLESQGHVKFDILAIDLLSKIMNNKKENNMQATADDYKSVIFSGCSIESNKVHLQS